MILMKILNGNFIYFRVKYYPSLLLCMMEFLVRSSLPKTLPSRHTARGKYVLDPLDQPTVTTGIDHCFRTCPFYMSVIAILQNLAKKTNVKRKQCSILAEWIIDDTCLVSFLKIFRTPQPTARCLEQPGFFAHHPQQSGGARQASIN